LQCASGVVRPSTADNELSCCYNS